MKIYIMTDLEGISGVDSIDMIPEANEGYRRAVQYLCDDINAAVEGAFRAGATEVVVRDGHGSGKNFSPDMLDPRATYDDTKAYAGMLDDSFAGVFVIGAHAMAGTANAFLDHTQSSICWHNYYINGIRSGELAQYACMAGHHNVPILFVSGDEAACQEARAFFAGVETAAVKNAIGRNHAECYDRTDCLDKIQTAAQRSISRIGKIRPYRPLLPMEIRVEFNRADYCDAAVEAKPYLERLDARTVRKITNSNRDILL